MTPNTTDTTRTAASPDRRVALIAGGTSGVGMACARQLLSEGVQSVMLTGRNLERAHSAAATLQAEFPTANISTQSADVGTVDGANQAVGSTLEQFGRLDVVICSTVPSDVAPELLARIPINDVQAILTEIAMPPLLLTRASLLAMKQQGGGSIVLVASDAAKVATPGETVVGAAMAAITMYTRASALELKRDGIRVNCVTPSLIADTPTSERVLAGGFSAKIFKKATELAALGVPTAHEVAQLVCHLAGPQSSTVTGQVVSINGGISTG